MYTIYVHCRKIYNLFVQALETDRNFIFTECTYIVFIKFCKNCKILLMRVEPSIVQIFCQSMLCCYCLYLFTIHELGTKPGDYTREIKLKFIHIHVPLLSSKCNDWRIKHQTLHD